MSVGSGICSYYIIIDYSLYNNGVRPFISWNTHHLLSFLSPNPLVACNKLHKIIVFKKYPSNFTFTPQISDKLVVFFPSCCLLLSHVTPFPSASPPPPRTFQPAVLPDSRAASFPFSDTVVFCVFLCFCHSSLRGPM